MVTKMASFNVETIRKDFPNLKQEVNGKPLVYLDNAATTFKPQCVIDTICSHYQNDVSNVHRGVHTLSERATAAYESARDSIRSFINAKDSKEVIMTSGTTESINLVAQAFGRSKLNKGDEILISEMEHHSNIVPWQMLCEEKECILKVIPINDQGELIYEEYLKLLNEKTKLVAIVYISNSLGTINPVKKMIEEAHKVSALVLVDAAQAISHCTCDVQDLDSDFLAFSSHKLFGPTGVGVLYGKESILNEMPPYKGGGDMIASVTFEKTLYNVLPYKYEAGTPNISGVIGLAAAIRYVESIGLENVQQHKKDLLEYAHGELAKIESLRFIGSAANKTSIISFVHPAIHAHDMGTLTDQEGVAIRTGHHCTQPVMKHFKIPATSRASISIYNTKEEIDQLVFAVKKAIKTFQ